MMFLFPAWRGFFAAGGVFPAGGDSSPLGGYSSPLGWYSSPLGGYSSPLGGDSSPLGWDAHQRRCFQDPFPLSDFPAVLACSVFSFWLWTRSRFPGRMRTT